ncbi:MAG TPA: hypothetical protein VF982_02970, partial [Anaerolineales bacterium]
KGHPLRLLDKSAVANTPGGRCSPLLDRTRDSEEAPSTLPEYPDFAGVPDRKIGAGSNSHRSRLWKVALQELANNMDSFDPWEKRG